MGPKARYDEFKQDNMYHNSVYKGSGNLDDFERYSLDNNLQINFCDSLNNTYMIL